MAQKQTTLDELLAKLPKRWGRWGDKGEIGCLNFQTPATGSPVGLAIGHWQDLLTLAPTGIGRR